MLDLESCSLDAEASDADTGLRACPEEAGAPIVVEGGRRRDHSMLTNQGDAIFRDQHLLIVGARPDKNCIAWVCSLYGGLDGVASMAANPDCACARSMNCKCSDGRDYAEQKIHGVFLQCDDAAKY